ncbi:MAG: hypothetical protein ACKODU_02710 [Limnohabitans sp.]
MNIHQLNVSHVERHDRLLLKLNTQTAQEFRFWLTRRLAIRLMPALEQAIGRLESTQPGVLAPDPASQKILTELKRGAFLTQADFQTPYSDQIQHLPLGEEPMIVTDVQLTVQASGVQITLQDKGAAPNQQHNCQLNLSPSLLHGMVHLLRQAFDKAQWFHDAMTISDPRETPVTSEGYRH